MTRRIAARRSPIHGNGVFALVDIAKGVELIEYRGKLLTVAQADRKYANSSDTGHTFLFTLNDTYVIDANQGGNIARWINHSCAPNCKAFIHEDPGGDPRKDRVVIEALRAARGRGADLRLWHRAGGAPDPAAQGDLGLPLRRPQLLRHAAATQAATPADGARPPFRPALSVPPRLRGTAQNP